jgi:hypothetical protein
MTIGGPMSLATTTVSTAGNSTFPQTAGNVGGIVVEIDDVDAGNVAISETTIDTSDRQNVTVAEIRFHGGVSIENMNVSKNLDTSLGPRHVQLTGSDASVDQATFYVSEVYADRWTGENSTAYAVWTTSPEDSSELSVNGTVTASDVKFNAHTVGLSDQWMDSYGIDDGHYSVSLNVSCDGC